MFLGVVCLDRVRSLKSRYMPFTHHSFPGSHEAGEHLILRFMVRMRLGAMQFHRMCFPEIESCFEAVN